MKESIDSTIPNKIETILLKANSLEPELTSDIFLKVVKSKKIKDNLKNKQILEEAFYLSFNAKEKFARKVIDFEGQVLTFRPTFISYASKYKLDALSLQVRIILKMLKIDKERALELFNEISPNLAAKSLSCQDFLVYQISDFYELVGKIAKISFTQEQIKEGQRITFLSSYIENITSPSQTSPIVKMLISLELTNNEILNLTGILNKSLRRISGDDRAFSFETLSDSTISGIYEYSKKLRYSPALYEDFRDSYKQYIVKNSQGIRCKDNVNFDKRRSKVISTNQSGMLEMKLPSYIYIDNLSTGQ